MTPFQGCQCGSLRFIAGPRGGSSQNVTCMGCSAGYNLLIPPVPGGFMLLQEFSAPTGKPPDTAGAAYIIEIVPRSA